MKINKSYDQLQGVNIGIVRQRLGRIHVCHSLLEAARKTRPEKMRTVPRQLRRGWVKAVIDTWYEYKNTYHQVMNKTKLKPMKQLSVFDF